MAAGESKFARTAAETFSLAQVQSAATSEQEDSEATARAADAPTRMMTATTNTMMAAACQSKSDSSAVETPSLAQVHNAVTSRASSEHEDREAPARADDAPARTMTSTTNTTMLAAGGNGGGWLARLRCCVSSPPPTTYHAHADIDDGNGDVVGQRPTNENCSLPEGIPPGS